VPGAKDGLPQRKKLAKEAGKQRRGLKGGRYTQVLVAPT
jgi:hypothetical protein